MANEAMVDIASWTVKGEWVVPPKLMAIYNPDKPPCEKGDICWDHNLGICRGCIKNPYAWFYGGKCWNCDREMSANVLRNSGDICIICQEEEVGH